MTHREFVKGLRDAADFFESHPDLGAPSDTAQTYTFAGRIGDEADAPSVDSREGLERFARIVGGHITKDGFGDTFYRLIADKGNFVVRALAYRDKVCERVQVGTKNEPEHTVPAQPAQPETVVPAREVPVYEWHCPTVLSTEVK